MECPKCSGNMEEKTGSVYGQPKMKSKRLECPDCGLVQNVKQGGVYIPDEVDFAIEKKKSNLKDK